MERLPSAWNAGPTTPDPADQMDSPRSRFRHAIRSPAFWRWAAVAAGILIRLVHVLRDPPLWHDEAALVLNAVHLDLSECFGKLLHHEAAPPLFLVLERLTVESFGDSEL